MGGGRQGSQGEGGIHKDVRNDQSISPKIKYVNQFETERFKSIFEKKINTVPNQFESKFDFRWVFVPVLFSIISTNRNLLDFGVHIISRAFRKGVFCRKGSDGCQVLVKNFSDGLSLDEQTLTYLLTRYRSAWCSWGGRKEVRGGGTGRRGEEQQ